MPESSVAEMPKAYAPREHEDRIRARWEASGAFHAEPAPVLRGERPPYCILIPPPNVTAALHLGHALNNTLQDVLVRAHRMKGFETLWMPGTDHAGIATQAVVEKRLLAEEGRRRSDFSREEFVARVQAWKDEYEARITDQLRRLGASCDWERQRFTMDPVCARAVREAFFRLFKAGLIYRGKRLVNWDPVLQTALADDEVENREVEGRFYYLRYPLVHPPTNPDDAKDCQEVTWNELAARGYPGADAFQGEENAWVTVATTRPETYLGDSGVAINPNDPRAVALRGLMVQLPIVGRVIPIVEDDYVVMPDPDSQDPKARMATGFLKVTPAHDPNDEQIGKRHGLRVINVMAPDASISDAHGWNREAWGEGGHVFVGKSREEARELVVREFQARGLLEKIRPHTHSVGHSDRSKVPIEPYLSDQWYVRVTDDRLVGEAQRALALEQRSTETYRSRDVPGDHEMRFFPARYARTYEAWHDNLRDWCISRQLWWGHRIPVWHRRMVIQRGDAPIAGEFGAIGLDHLVDGEYAHGAIHIQDASGNPIDPREMRTPDHERERTIDVFVCYDGTDPRDAQRIEAAGFTQDPDVLDTWFSSALWPMSTMGWPDPSQAPEFAGLLEAFNPTSVLSTGRDIITLWVSRMAMFNRFLLSDGATDRRSDGEQTLRSPGPVPFRDVYIHPIIQDGHGQRMSKSLGNGVDPLDLIHSHGADALRFTLCQIATSTQDVRMPVDLACPHCAKAFEPKTTRTAQGFVVAAPEQTCPACARGMVSAFGVSSGLARPTLEKPLARNTSTRLDEGRNFCNKLWNASRFAIAMLDDSRAGAQAPGDSPQELSLPDRWMLSRLARAIDAMDGALREYQFARCAEVAYDLLWRDFCDWYLESIKPTVESDPLQRGVLRAVLDAILRLLHPMIPFVTETIYERLRQIDIARVPGLDLAPPSTDSLLCTAPWPVIDPAWISVEAEGEFERLQTLIRAIRDVRSQQKVHPRRSITLHVDPETAREFHPVAGIVRTLAGIGQITAPGAARPDAAVAFRFGDRELYLSDLADALDSGAERERLRREITEFEKSLAALDKRLGNPGYADKAPPRLVEQTRAQREKVALDLAAARAALERLP